MKQKKQTRALQGIQCGAVLACAAGVTLAPDYGTFQLLAPIYVNETDVRLDWGLVEKQEEHALS